MQEARELVEAKEGSLCAARLLERASVRAAAISMQPRCQRCEACQASPLVRASSLPKPKKATQGRETWRLAATEPA